MTILITGTEGFIGKQLFEKIRSNTPHEIVTFDPAVDKNRTKLYGEYDIIYHLGAVSDTREQSKEKIYDCNFEILRILIEVQRNSPKPAFISFASSASVYGSTEDPSWENDPVNPKSLYAKSKYLGELMLELSGLEYNILRLFNVYSLDGIAEEHKIGHSSPHHKFLKQNPIEVFDLSTQAHRDFIHVDEVVEAFQVLTGKVGTFNVGSGCAKSFFDVAVEISEITGAEIVTVPFPKELSENYQWFTESARSISEILKNP